MRLQLIAALAGALPFLLAPTGAHAQDGPWRLTTDTLVYGDDDNVLVVSPQVAVHRAIDDGGGEVSARVVVDAISAASVDVVSHATPRFDEVRTEVVLGAGKAFGDQLPSLAYRASFEPDYRSQGLRGAYQTRLGTPDTVLSAGYGITRDLVGRSGTPLDVHSETLMSHAADIALTQVFGQRTVARVVYTLTAQSGYLEKPYRHVAMFDQAGLDAANADGVALGLDTFDAYRRPERPPEEVPDRRYRHALALRGLRHLQAIDASLRLDLQVYGDSWGVWAGMAEPGFDWQLAAHWRMATYLRIYQQSAASFWERAYTLNPDGSLPRWRTVDRDLAPSRTETLGVRGEWTWRSIAAYVEGAAALTQYTDYMFLDTRLAVFSLAGFRWTP